MRTTSTVAASIQLVSPLFTVGAARAGETAALRASAAPSPRLRKRRRHPIPVDKSICFMFEALRCHANREACRWQSPLGTINQEPCQPGRAAGIAELLWGRLRPHNGFD